MCTMRRIVHTPDGVEWTIAVGRPRLRGGAGDLTVGHGEREVGFGPLVIVLGVVLLGLLSPVLWETGRWWAFGLLVPLGVAGWFLLARYPVAIRRHGSDEPVHVSYVAGRRQSRRIAGELADEIARTPDAQL